MSSNNPPEVVLKLTRKQAESLLEHCEANIKVALATLETHTISLQLEQKLEGLIEEFKALRKATERALKQD